MTIDSNELLGAAGIAVSIGTFWFGYRQTLGARQERVRTADTNIENSLLKRIVLQDYSPGFADIERMISGMATIARVPVAALRKADDVLNLLLTRVLENDLIENERRTKIIDLLLNITPKDLSESPGASTDEERWSNRLPSIWFLSYIGLIIASAGIGTLAFVLTSKNGFASRTNVTYFLLALLSVGVVAGALVWRSGQRPDSRAGNSQRAKELKTYPPDNDVRDALTTLTKLTPLEVSALRSLHEDEVDSAKNGWTAGLYTRRGGTPWHEALKQRGLAVAIDPPRDAAAARGREYVVLTKEGSLIARILGANSGNIPDVLNEIYKNSTENQSTNKTGPDGKNSNEPASTPAATS